MEALAASHPVLVSKLIVEATSPDSSNSTRLKPWPDRDKVVAALLVDPE